MPRIIDFKTVSDKKIIQTFPAGWVNPLLIEYGIKQLNDYDPCLSVVWRVVGTEHSWVIFEQRINILSKGDYKSHFENALENFRTILLYWIDDTGYKDLEWVKEYANIYKDYIIDNDGKHLLSERGKHPFEDGLKNFTFDKEKIL